MAFYRSAFKAMGSPCDIQLYAESHAEAERVAGTAIAEVARLEAVYSRFRSDSFLAAINRVAASGGCIAVDEETSALLNYAATCYRESEGLFDITSGILRRAWRFDRGELPDHAHVQDLLDKVGWHRLRWTPPVLEFPTPGMEIDFGGVVKEYAADRAAVLCREAGMRHGIVNFRRRHQDNWSACGWQPVADRHSPSPSQSGRDTDTRVACGCACQQRRL